MPARPTSERSITCDGRLNRCFRTGINVCPPARSFADFALVRQEKADSPDVARCWTQKEPARKLINFKNIPTLQMSAEASFGAPTAQRNSD